jgi:hypothetical protein
MIFFNAIGERPAEIHKQIVAVCGKVMNRQNVIKFLHLKKHLVGKKFDEDDELQEEAMTWFKRKATDFHDSGMQKLVPRLNKYLSNAGEYVEK